MLVDTTTGTRVDEVAEGIYRIHTPVPTDAMPGGGFSFNQYLIAADQPLLFHAGPRRMFPLVRKAIDAVMPVEGLAHVGLSHVEADECGGLNDLLAAAPRAVPVCSTVAAMVSIEDMADRPPRALADGERLDLGDRQVRWLDAPHLPHGWDCGYLYDDRSRTLLCGDLFTQPGTGDAPLVESDILGPSEHMRADMDYFAHCPRTTELLHKLAATRPQTLACMHGSAWRGDGAALLGALATALSEGEGAPGQD